MRVIAGTLGGRPLAAPRGRATRPTSDRVREALFSILGELGRLGGEEVLDLFAGSGALAIEALSRGASGATLVDSSPRAVAVIRANLAALEIDALGVAVEVVPRDALAFLGAARRDGRQYDLVFVDPPYERADALRAPLSEALAPVLSPGGRVVAESDRRRPLALSLPLIDERRYGDTMIQIHSR